MQYKRYFFRLSVATDCLINAVVNGLIGQTLSVRAWTARADGRRWGCILCRLLEYPRMRWVGFGPDHCDTAAINEEIRLREAIDDIQKHSKLKNGPSTLPM